MDAKKLFWNVDTQRDFMDEDGKLKIEGAWGEDLRHNLAKLTKYANSKGIKVVNTCDWHNANSKELSSNPDFMNTFPEHCIANSIGSDFIPETDPLNFEGESFILDHDCDHIDHSEMKSMVKECRNIVIRKDAFDVFVGNAMTDSVLSMLNLNKSKDIVYVYGIASNVCVDQAVKGLVSRGYNVKVVVDAIKELPIPGYDKIVENWVNSGVKLVTTDSIVK